MQFQLIRSAATGKVPRPCHDQRGHRPFSICTFLPHWLFNMVPAWGRTHFLQAAAITASHTDGHRIRLGQVSYVDRITAHLCTLHFTNTELNDLRRWGRAAQLSTWASTLRTAIFVGLQVPGAERGIISPPRLQKGHPPWHVSKRHLVAMCKACGISHAIPKDGQPLYVHTGLDPITGGRDKEGYYGKTC